MSQTLRGLVGQSMSGSRKAQTPTTRIYSPGTYTFTPTKSGWYRFVLFGGGAGSNNGTYSGASGALVVATRNLAAGVPVTIVVGALGARAGGNGGDTTVTLKTGEVLTAQGGQGVTGGTATGNATLGDTLTNGSNGTSGAGAGLAGANAPSTSDYIGGTGAAGSQENPGGSPGAGGATNSASGTEGGSGLAVVVRVRMRA